MTFSFPLSVRVAYACAANDTVFCIFISSFLNGERPFITGLANFAKPAGNRHIKRIIDLQFSCKVIEKHALIKYFAVTHGKKNEVYQQNDRNNSQNRNQL